MPSELQSGRSSRRSRIEIGAPTSRTDSGSARRASRREMASPPVAFLPFHLGDHVFAVEARAVVGVGSDQTALPSRAGHRRIIAPLARLLGLAGGSASETVVTDGGDSRLVMFGVESTARLVHLPVHTLQPLPPLTEETIAVRFLWGVAASELGLLLLVDPERLADAVDAEGRDD